MEIKKIIRLFKGKLVGNDIIKYHVSFVLSKMPDETIEFVTKNCWFMGSVDDAWAFTFTGNDLANQHLVFLSDELFRQSEKQIHFSIAHEIGHIVLNHRNSVFEKQSKEEIVKQETEANKFASTFFS